MEGELGEVVGKLQRVEQLLAEIRDTLRAFCQKKKRTRKPAEPLGNWLLRTLKEYAVEGKVNRERLQAVATRAFFERNLHRGLFRFWLENLCRVGVIEVAKSEDGEIVEVRIRQG